MAKYRIVAWVNSINDNKYWVVERKTLFKWKVLGSGLPGYGFEEDRYYTLKGAKDRVLREQRVDISSVVWRSDE